MITHDDLIEILGATNARTLQKVTARIGSILALAEPFRNQGYAFTFAGNASLDANVRKLLVELADDLYSYVESNISKSIDKEDRNNVILLVTSLKNTQEEIDKYCSHLYYIMEGWIAIAFAKEISKARLYTEITTYMENPYTSPLWTDAFNEGLKYASGIVATGGYHWGKGTPINPVKGLNIVQNDAINTAFHYGSMEVYRRAGAIGYKVHRNSTYFCPVCDEACQGWHPLDEIVVPLHPNCVCYTTPVYSTEE